MTNSILNFISRKIEFFSDEYLLRGTLHLPHAYRPPVVIGSHGLFSDSNSPKQIELARRCNTFGIGFFRFDHRGCGESSGSFHKTTSLESRCNDLACAIETIRSEGDTGKLTGLFGSSMGGAACLSVASEFKIDVIVTVAAPLMSNPIIEAAENSDETTREDLLFYKKNLQFNISNKLSGIKNILIFHGDTDEIVPPSHAKTIFQYAKDPKKLIMQKNGDHQMSNLKHRKNFIEESIKWFRSSFDK